MQKTQVRAGMSVRTQVRVGKGVNTGCYSACVDYRNCNGQSDVDACNRSCAQDCQFPPGIEIRAGVAE